MDYILQTSHLTKKYKNFPALNDLTMNIPKGSIYGFVGKNGAGKTTLIRLICGLQEPTSGDFTLYCIRNDSRDIFKSRRRMGAVVETPSIYMDMTAEENLKQQYLILGLPSFDGIPELLKFVGLDDTGKKIQRGHIFAGTETGAHRYCPRIGTKSAFFLCSHAGKRYSATDQIATRTCSP